MVEHLLGNLWKIESNEVIKGLNSAGSAEIQGPVIVRVDILAGDPPGLQIQSYGGQKVFTKGNTDFESIVHETSETQ